MKQKKEQKCRLWCSLHLFELTRTYLFHLLLHSSLVVFNHRLGVVFEVEPHKDTVNQWWADLNTHNKSLVLFPPFCVLYQRLSFILRNCFLIPFVCCDIFHALLSNTGGCKTHKKCLYFSHLLLPSCKKTFSPPPCSEKCTWKCTCMPHQIKQILINVQVL